METAQHGDAYWRRLDNGRIERWDAFSNEWQVWDPTMGDPPPEFLGPYVRPAAPAERTTAAQDGGFFTRIDPQYLKWGRWVLVPLLVAGSFLFRRASAGQPFTGYDLKVEPGGPLQVSIWMMIKHEGAAWAQGGCRVTVYAGDVELGSIWVINNMDQSPGSSSSATAIMYSEGVPTERVDRAEVDECREIT